MIVTHIIYSGLGGQGDYLFPLIKKINKKKLNDKHVIIFYGVENILLSYKAFCIENSIDFYFIKSDAAYSGFKYVKLLRKIQPEFIFVHTSVVFKSFLFGLTNKSKVIFVDHASNNIKRIHDWLNLIFACLFYDKLIFLAKFHIEEIKNNIFFKMFEHKFRLVLPGIKLNKKKKKKLKLQKKNFIKIGMASRFVDGKNHKNLIDCFEKMDQSLSQKIRLELVGNGPNFNKIKNYIKKKNISKNIHLFGFKDPRLMKDWYCSLDAYVHWTNGEVVSRSILEEMNNGTIILASDIPSTREQLKNPIDCGILFKNKKEFVNKITKIHNEEFGINELRINCRKQIKEKYNLNIFVDKMNKIIEAN